MGILFEIATNKENDLETRYAATRTMQGLKEKREKLSKFELEVYLAFLMYGRSNLAQHLNMTKDSVNAAITRIREKGYEV